MALTQTLPQRPAAEVLQTGLEALVHRPPGNDPVIRDMGTAALAELAHNEDMHSMVEAGLGQRYIQPAYAAGLLRMCLQEQVLTRFGSDEVKAPFDRYDVDRWRDVIQDSARPGAPSRAQIIQHLRNDTVVTNVTRRYLPPKLVATLLRHRVGPDPDVLDIGSSRMIGLKRLMLADSLRELGLIRNVLEPHEPEIIAPSGLQPGRYIRDEELHHKIKQVNRAFFKPRAGIGGDIMPMVGSSTEEKRMASWVRSSYYPTEYAKGVLLEYDFLDMANPDNVTFYRGDFTDLDVADFGEKSPVKKFDIVMALTMTYELHPTQQHSMRETVLRHLLKPDGIYIEQDFMRRADDDPSTLVSDADSFGEPFQYRTHVLDPRDPHLRFMEWFVSESGRPRRMMLGRDFGRLGGAINQVVRL